MLHRHGMNKELYRKKIDISIELFLIDLNLCVDSPKSCCLYTRCSKWSIFFVVTTSSHITVLEYLFFIFNNIS